MQANISRNFQICISVPVLHCILFLYLTSMIKIVNETDKDRLIPNLHQNMEPWTRSTVLAH